jgi:hypothetical protein
MILPPRNANLNALAERFVESTKDECFGRMIFFDETSLQHAITQYVEHYHHESRRNFAVPQALRSSILSTRGEQERDHPSKQGIPD